MALSKCSGTSFSAAVNSNNQFTGYTYDAAGNLTNDGLYSYTYNAESEITTANGVTYTYDGNRMRVAKSSAPLYWRDINGNTIAQTTLNGTNQTEFVFFAGHRVARVNANGLVYYYQADQIGSTRSMTNSSGVRCYDADFPPYGTENSYTTTCSPLYKFAGYERDTETGLDYAANRYYNSRIGRFMTPDPAGLAAANLSNPQSLNRYAFVLNNPLTGIDPWGLECVFIHDDGNSIEEVDPTGDDYDSAECAGDGGTYFRGNNEVNNDNWQASNGNWNNFDLDPDSNWVGLTNDNGVPQQAACTGSANNCTGQELKDMGSEYVSKANSLPGLGVQGSVTIGNGSILINGSLKKMDRPSMFCRVSGRVGDFMAGVGLGVQSQAGWEGFSIITGEELVAGSEFGPVGWGLVLSGAGLQVANDLICE